MKPSDGRMPVAISGLGVVSCHGTELSAHRKALEHGSCLLREVDRSAGYHRSSGARLGALVDPACYRSILPPLQARRMSPPSRYAIVAARLALEDAGLAADSLASTHGEDATAVVLGTSYGPSSYTERILRQILLESPLAASPMLFTESVANAPAAQVALALDCKGPNVTVTQREASALLAVAEGCWLIQSGRVRRALVGGVEELNPLLHAILDRFGALAGSRSKGISIEGEMNLDAEDRSEQARPLDRYRDGFNAAEGAGVLVLERAEDLERRGGTARAWLGPVARAFDPFAPTTGWSATAPATVERLVSIFQQHGWIPGLSGLISGANGSQTGDRLEAWMLQRVRDLCGGPVPVAVPKSFLGEQGMASLVGALLYFEGLSSAGQREFCKDDDLGLEPDLGVLPIGKFLLSSLAAGGSCCWLGLESG